MTQTQDLSLAVLLPCYNEAITIGKVVDDFKKALPQATIYVFDNNSSDDTAKIAAEHGATVVHSPKQGKGNVIRHMFNYVDADVYIMADGDDTYPPSEAQRLIDVMLKDRIDMLVGARLDNHHVGAFRSMHMFGNKLVAFLISFFFSVKLTDILSGYRVFSRDYVKTIPLLSRGFDIETEMTLQAIAKNFSVKEVTIPYGVRPEGSESKLNTYLDGMLVLKAIFKIFKDYRPFIFYTTLAVIIGILSIAAGIMPIIDYVQTGFVSHIPLSILATGLAITAMISLSIGIILDSIYKYQQEHYELGKRILSATQDLKK